jgi:hypothetical protein
LKTMKTLQALTLDELADNAMDDIWISRWRQQSFN